MCVFRASKIHYVDLAVNWVKKEIFGELTQTFLAGNYFPKNCLTSDESVLKRSKRWWNYLLAHACHITEWFMSCKPGNVFFSWFLFQLRNKSSNPKFLLKRDFVANQKTVCGRFLLRNTFRQSLSVEDNA